MVFITHRHRRRTKSGNGLGLPATFQLAPRIRVLQAAGYSIAGKFFKQPLVDWHQALDTMRASDSTPAGSVSGHECRSLPARAANGWLGSWLQAALLHGDLKDSPMAWRQNQMNQWRGDPKIEGLKGILSILSTAGHL